MKEPGRMISERAKAGYFSEIRGYIPDNSRMIRPRALGSIVINKAIYS